MAIRKFWLINSQNNRFDFTLKTKKAFLESPSGLGFSKTLDGIRVGDDTIFTSDELDIPQISGNVLFYDDNEKAYRDYDNFVKFIRYTPLKLYYQPPHLLSGYYTNCVISSLEKGERSTEGYLSCPITFTCSSIWNNSSVNGLVVTNGQSLNGKYYPLKRPYNYATNSLSDITINVDSDKEVGFIFEIIGDVTNPLLQITQNEKQYGIVKIDGNFDYLKLDSNDDNEDLYLEKDEIALTNPLIYQDLSIADGTSQVTFVKLNVGENKLSFSCDNVNKFEGYIRFTWKDRRISI